MITVDGDSTEPLLSSRCHILINVSTQSPMPPGVDGRKYSVIIYLTQGGILFSVGACKYGNDFGTSNGLAALLVRLGWQSPLQSLWGCVGVHEYAVGRPR